MPRDNRCMYMAHVCIYVCCRDCVWVCGNVCCVAAVVKDIGILSLRVLKYVVCLCSGCDGCCVLCLYCDAWSTECSCMGSMSVSSCRCCMFVSCVHPMAVVNVAFCMACSLLLLVEDARDNHMEDAYSIYICCVCFASLDVFCDELNDCAWNLGLYQHSDKCVYVYIVSKALLISSATVIVRAGGAIWLNPFATVLFSVCSAVTVECCVLYPCCMGVFGMFAVM